LLAACFLDSSIHVTLYVFPKAKGARRRRKKGKKMEQARTRRRKSMHAAVI
jgi:hypothetical protein